MPLHLAAMNGHLPVVRMLIDAKAKVDAMKNYKCEFLPLNNIESNEIFVCFCVNRYTVVYYAAFGGHAKIVHWLVKVRYFVSVRYFHRSRHLLF